MLGEINYDFLFFRNWKEQRPTWGKHCTQCLACINRCPVQAIQFTKATVSKGRYVHPDL
ncbi:MAG: 4Fe-4S binding protein [Ruminiclostridium sp.]|nr:4Fe-4S binding protein [Ruminiclostridium sp.]